MGEAAEETWPPRVSTTSAPGVQAADFLRLSAFRDGGEGEGCRSWTMARSLQVKYRRRRWRTARLPTTCSPAAAPCCSSATATVCNHGRNNSSAWWVATAVRHRCEARPQEPKPSLDEVAAFLHLAVRRAPGHDGHTRCRVLRRALDQLVRIDHVDQHVALGVAATHDLHLLEEQRAALPEHVVGLLQLALEADRADLPACQRDVGDLLGKPQPAGEAPLLRHGEVAGDPVDLRVVDAIGGEPVVRAHQLEDGRATEDQVGFVRSENRRKRKCERDQQQQEKTSQSGALACGNSCHETLREHRARPARAPHVEPKSGTEIMDLAALLAVTSEMRIVIVPMSQTGRRPCFRHVGARSLAGKAAGWRCLTECEAFLLLLARKSRKFEPPRW